MSVSHINASQTNLTISIKIIVLQVPHHRILTIRQEALLRPHSRPREVGLQRTSTAICLGDIISMVCPDIAEYINEIRVIV